MVCMRVYVYVSVCVHVYICVYDCVYINILPIVGLSTVKLIIDMIN